MPSANTEDGASAINDQPEPSVTGYALVGRDPDKREEEGDAIGPVATPLSPNDADKPPSRRRRVWREVAWMRKKSSGIA